MQAMRTDRGWSAVGLGLVFIMTVLFGDAHADGFRNPPESATALGRAGGKIAGIDDASAVTINPANMVLLESPQVMAGVTLGYGRKEFRSVTGAKTRSDDPWAYMPALFYAMPLGEGPWAFGVGATVPFGRFTDFGADAPFGEITPYYSSLRVININPGLALAVSETLALGLGVSLYDSALEFKQRFQGAPVRFKGDGQAFGVNAGLSWALTGRQKLALTYRSPFDVDYDGTVRAGALSLAGDFETEFKFPSVVTLGYAVHVTPAVTLEVNVEWIEHSRNDELVIDVGPYNALLDPGATPDNPPRLAQDWKDNWTYGAGIEWKPDDTWVARAGYMYLETPTVSSTLIPVNAEESQHVLSFGVGYRAGRQRFDLGYAYGIIPDRTIRDHDLRGPDGTPGPLNGTYSFEAHSLGFAYALAF